MKTLTLSLILFASVCFGQSKVDSLSEYIRKNGVSTDSMFSSITIDTSKYPINFQDYTLYKINWRKVKTIADLKLILEAFDLRVTGNSQAYKKIKKYLIEAK